MLVDKKDGTKERRLVTALIVDPVVLGAVSQKWESPGFFRSRAANLIAGWCVRYYKKYGRCPGKNVESLFEHWSDKSERDQETKDSIESLLASLSGEYVRLKKTSQSQYLLDLAGDYFTESRLKDYAEQLDVLIRNGDVHKADTLMKQYAKVELGTGSTVDVLEDDQAWSRAFQADHEPPLVVYPGAAGQFYQDILCRNAFVAFEGQTGIGKSWILQDIAWRAMEQGHRVAMFQCGDMSEDQILMRIAARVGNRPIKAGEVRIPVSIEPPQANGVHVVHTIKKWENDMTERKAAKYRARLRAKSWYKERPLRLETYPARGISIYGIKARLDQWASQDWNADVVVIDYADILAPPSGQFGDREDINTTWITMRSISVQYHCLVATATQVNRGGYDSMKLKLENTADDRRKMDHVTASVGLTGTEEEVERGIFRHAWIKPPRRRKVNMTRTLFTAGALEVANPCILSIM